MMKRSCAVAALAMMGFGGKASAAPTFEQCTVNAAAKPLPSQVRESSGLALGRRDAGIFWTHNDAGNTPVVYAVTGDGTLRSQVRVAGARLEDWEDIESGTCGGSSCLFIGDIGDNDAKRSMITVYQVEEPPAGATTTANATIRTARYPGGPRDAEAMFVIGGTIYVVTKGRTGPIELYRWPEGNGTVTLTKLSELLPKPRNSQDFVTSASASPDGKWVAIRTYRTLYLYKAAELTGSGKATPVTADLTAAGETQGEGVALMNDGTVWLSSEGGGKNRSPVIAKLSCTLPG
jgi:hypothetical protein